MGFRNLGFRVSKVIAFGISDHLLNHQSISGIRHQAVSPMILRQLFSSSTDGFGDPSPPLRRRSSGGLPDRRGEDDRRHNRGRGQGQGGRRRDFEYSGGRTPDNTNQKSGYYYNGDSDRSRVNNRVSSELNRPSRQKSGTWSNGVASSRGLESEGNTNSSYFPFDDDEQKPRYSRGAEVNNGKSRDDEVFLEKFKLGIGKDKESNSPDWKESDSSKGSGEGEAVAEQPLPLPLPEDADAIFRKMKETGLIPNAVAMLHGLCTDGLIQEAMKLFGLMRERGTIPEVVVYTAVVEGFCKAQKLEDAKRIFRKMQANGVVANAFSYGVLVQGLCKGRMLDDAFEYCLEMVEAGHSPNLATFVGLVDGFCRERSLEAAQTMISNLRDKGYCFDEKAVREFLDKKGPFLPLVWEAILGRKSSQHF